MKIRKFVGLALMVLACVGICSTITLAAINEVFVGDKVTVTSALGSIQYTVNPFTTWTPTISTEIGATWRTRLANLTLAYTGTVSIAWKLYNAGPDGIIGNADDSFMNVNVPQSANLTSGVPKTIVASSDGTNPYNWGQWTTSPMGVYVTATVTGS